jgi:hypothetical protein
MPDMSIVYELIVVVHLLGMAAVVGSWFVVLRSPRIAAGMVHGALLQLVSGIALVGLRESGAVSGMEELDRIKVTVKLAVALVVAVLAWANRKRDAVPSGLVHAVGGLAVVNVLIAALWE